MGKGVIVQRKCHPMDNGMTLSMNEIKRLYILQQVFDLQTTGDQAAQRLGLSLRQIRQVIACPGYVSNPPAILGFLKTISSGRRLFL